MNDNDRYWWQRKPKKSEKPAMPPFVPPPTPMKVEESAADTALLKQLGFPDRKKPPQS